ncbi:DUF2946 family protein [Leptothrix sp. BB-4]
MTSLRTRAHLAWLGILLVLMPLIAPSISHALLRAQDGATPVGWSMGWCSPATTDAGPADAAVDVTADANVNADRQAPAGPAHLASACDYCGWPVGTSPLPGLAADLLTPALTRHGSPLAPDTPSPARPRATAHGARAPPTSSVDAA